MALHRRPGELIEMKNQDASQSFLKDRRKDRQGCHRQVLIANKNEIIKPKYLISDELLAFSKSIVQKNIITIWFNKKKTSTSVSGGVYGPQIIQTRRIKPSLINGIMDELKSLSTWVNLRFKQVRNKNKSILRIYNDQNIQIAGMQDILGIATMNNKHWEIFINGSNVSSRYSFIYTALHEISHALGLEHPSDNTDRDKYFPINNSRKKEAEGTIMNRFIAKEKESNDYFSFNDLAALQQAWGKQPHQKNILKLSVPRKDISVNRIHELREDAITPPVNDPVIRGFATPCALIKGIKGDEIIGRTSVNKQGEWQMPLPKEMIQEIKYKPGTLIGISQSDHFDRVIDTLDLITEVRERMGISKLLTIATKHHLHGF